MAQLLIGSKTALFHNLDQDLPSSLSHLPSDENLFQKDRI